MIIGSYDARRVIEESTCRLVEAAQLTEIQDFKIHSTMLTPNIPFGSPMISPENIDPTIFINSDEYALDFPSQISTQNYFTCKYAGVLPFEDYSDGHLTSPGTTFDLICREGNTNYNYRAFGTDEGVHGFGTTRIVKRTTDGLVPKLPEDQGDRKFLRGDGKWAIPEEHKLNP